ncbi:Glutamate decarboxylase 1 [Vitis vinifera]|uniref:glutamate decarboxylase n=1 Tax=Vitis vinifera TaxID=29760 RepID=A0A438INS3_VITVI|nr:Glutamate decarboxylase 1 [Vitis vinifera]
MIAHLFNAPLGESEAAVGVGTVGSSEAIMLAGLAFKRKWQNKRKAEGKPMTSLTLLLELMFRCAGRNLQAVEMVDENTICVAAILGSTLNGEFEDVKHLNDLLTKKNKETGWDTPIHVDAASGGFIAPFLHPELEWDFRLPLVKSINVSGHKYGLVYAGIGWVIWRSKEDLPDELIFHINYLGADQPTFTLNFSKGPLPNYCYIFEIFFDDHNIMHAKDIGTLWKTVKKMQGYSKKDWRRQGTSNIVSKENGVPLVAFSLKDNSCHNEFEVSDMLRRYGWIVPAYTMPPDAQHVTVLRVVIREDFSRTLAERLVTDIQKVLYELDTLPAKITAKVQQSNKKSEIETQREITEAWKKFVREKKKTNGVC